MQGVCGWAVCVHDMPIAHTGGKTETFSKESQMENVDSRQDTFGAKELCVFIPQSTELSLQVFGNKESHESSWWVKKHTSRLCINIGDVMINI